MWENTLDLGLELFSVNCDKGISNPSSIFWRNENKQRNKLLVRSCEEDDWTLLRGSLWSTGLTRRFNKIYCFFTLLSWDVIICSSSVSLWPSVIPLGTSAWHHWASLLVWSAAGPSPPGASGQLAFATPGPAGCCFLCPNCSACPVT